MPNTLQEIISEFENKFPDIMGRNKVKRFPSEAFYELKAFLAQAYHLGEQNALTEAEKEVEKMMNDPKEFPKDGWNEWEQGAYKILEKIKSKLHSLHLSE